MATSNIRHSYVGIRVLAEVWHGLKRLEPDSMLMYIDTKDRTTITLSSNDYAKKASVVILWDKAITLKITRGYIRYTPAQAVKDSVNRIIRAYTQETTTTRIREMWIEGAPKQETAWERPKLP